MPGYTLVPEDYQPDFDDYSLVPVDYDPFAADDIIQRTRTQLASQPQPDAGFDPPPSAPQAPGSAPPLSPIVPNDGQGPSVPQPPGQDLHSQYQALRPTLGDRKAMLAGQQQPGQTSEPAPTGHVSGVTQQAQTQTQPTQPQPQSQPQQPATGAGQPDVNGPATGNSPSGSEGGNGLSPGGSDAGGGPNPTSDQAGASERLPFSGYADPSPTESLVNRQKMDDQADAITADPNKGRHLDGGELYRFVTTKLPIAEYPIDGGAGWLFTTDSPFYAFDGTRYGTVDASPARPVTVTIKEDGKFTISRP